MYEILTTLQGLYDKGYRRTIFNFYIVNENNELLKSIIKVLSSKIELINTFRNLFNDSELDKNNLSDFLSQIDLINYCVLNNTKILKNPEILQESKISYEQKEDQKYISINTENFKKMFQDKILFELINESENTGKLISYILNTKNAIKSYQKTINKKIKTNYGEMSKTCLNKNVTAFSGILTNDLQINEIRFDPKTPWIKKISSTLVVRIDKDKLIVGGRTGLTQSIDITLESKTCLILFKNGTIHILNSKKNENDFNDFINNILINIKFVCFLIMVIFEKDDNKDQVYQEACSSFDLINRSLKSSTTRDKIEWFKLEQFPFNTLKLGIVNLTYNLKSEVVNLDVIKNKRIKVYPDTKVNLISLTDLNLIRMIVKEFEHMKSDSEDTTDIYDNINPFIDKIDFIE